MKAALYLFLGFLFAIITTPVHEWGHWIAASLAGSEGIVYFDHFGIGGWFRYTSDPPYHFDWLVELSGGLTVFIILGAIGAIRMYLNRFPAGFIPVTAGCFHLFYGIYEMSI